MNALPAAHSFGIFDSVFRDGVRGTAEAVFPANDLGAPDHQATDLVARTETYVRGLPPTQRPMLALLFIAIELGAPVLTGRFKRFSRQPTAKRTASIDSWRTSWIYPMRILADALKATLGMIYLSHPKISRHIGEYKPFANPGDAFDVEIRPTSPGDLG